MILKAYLWNLILLCGKKIKKSRLIKKNRLNKEKIVNLSDMPSPLESDEEEIKEGKRLKILTPNKLLFRLPILLVQVIVGNNSCKLQNEIRQIPYLLYQHTKISKVY